MIPADAFRYQGFPTDGRLRWLRWLETIDLCGPTGSPTIRAHLGMLPEGTDLARLPPLRDVGGVAATTSVHPVMVGSLPALRLGMVFRDGVRVGDLAMDRFARRSYGGSADARLVRCDTEVPSPAWAKVPWRIIPADKYRLGRALGSQCLRLLHADVECLVPTSEVFRVLCAPESLLANALLSADWNLNRRLVLNEAFCQRFDGEWRVGLRSGLTGASARAVAAYHWTEAGTAARNRLREGFLKGDYRLGATIPFAFEDIALGGEGLALPQVNGTSRVLLLRIGSVAFPMGVRDLPRVVRFRLDNNNVERSPASGKDDPEPVVRDVPTVAADPAATERILSIDEPPSSRAVERRSPYESAELFGLPEVQRLPLDPPRPPEAERRRIRSNVEPTDVGSTALPQRGHRAVGAVGHMPVPAASSGFGSVTITLDGLLRDGLIESWMPTVPLESPWRSVDGVEAWELPAEANGRRLPFALLRDGRRRTCLVAEVQIDGRRAYMLELQRRMPSADDAERFRYLLLGSMRGDLEPVVSKALSDVAVRGGSWDDAALAKEGVESRAAKHDFQMVDGIKALNGNSFLRGLRSLLRAVGKVDFEALSD